MPSMAVYLLSQILNKNDLLQSKYITPTPEPTEYKMMNLLYYTPEQFF